MQTCRDRVESGPKAREAEPGNQRPNHRLAGKLAYRAGARLEQRYDADRKQEIGPKRGIDMFVADLLSLNESGAKALIEKQCRHGHDDACETDYSEILWSQNACHYKKRQERQNLSGELIGKPMVGTLISWLSFTCLGTALNSIAAALHIRRLRFSRFPQSSFISIVSGATVAIAMATAGFGVWSLVAFQLVTALTPSVVLWWGVNWQPRLSISWQALDDLIHFGLATTLGNLFRFAAERVDIIVIGYFLADTDSRVLLPHGPIDRHAGNGDPRSSG